MSRVRVGAVCAAAAALIASAAPAHAARNGEVAYHGRAPGLLYVQGPDGAGLRRLPAPGRPADPAFSPKGRRIAFASDGAIWVMNADGSDVRRLTPPGLRSQSPTWSPHGAAIAFVGGPVGARDIYRIALDGRRLHQITVGASDDEAPAWSSRGTIAFVRRTARGDGDIYSVPPAGGTPAQLTRGRGDDGAPAWAPTGRRIAFTRGSRKRRPQLYVMRASGSGQKRLTKLRRGVAAPAWAPDGREIAFATGRPGHRALHRLRLRGHKVRRVGSGATDVRSLTWQPQVVDEVTVAAAGDIACDPLASNFAGTPTACHMQQTSDLLLKMDLWAVLVLGDVQYEDGLLWKYEQSFHPTWGRVKGLIRPVLGNHEYVGDGGGAGYFDYFNGPNQPDGPAGPRAAGYYSFDVGAWHVVALNSQCMHPPSVAVAPGCHAGSDQEQWLRADLAAHPNKCTLAYWHHPLISSRLGVDETIRPLWQALYDGGVDVVLTAHDHSYERFAPVDALGNRDPVRGIRQFVVGTGGRSHQRAIAPAPNSEIRNQDTYGVLRLRLRPFGYYWNFLPEARHDFTDSGANACH